MPTEETTIIFSREEVLEMLEHKVKDPSRKIDSDSAMFNKNGVRCKLTAR